MTTQLATETVKQVVVRSFGAKLLGGQAAGKAASDVFRLQNKFWNRLVEIERASREAYNLALSQSDELLSALKSQEAQQEAALQDLMDARNRERARTRTKRTETDWAGQLKAASISLKELRTQIKSAKLAAREKAKPLTDEVERRRREDVKLAAAESGLWWSHKQAILDRYDVARVSAMKRGHVLQFHRYDGSGSMRVTVGSSAHPFTWEQVLDGRTQMVALRAATEEELGRKKAVGSDGTRRVVITARAGNKDDNGLIPKLDFLVSLHAGQEMPQNMPLRTVTLRRDIHVDKEDWKIVFMFSLSSEQEDRTAELPQQAVGVDFGFRIVRDGAQKALRVAAISSGDAVEYVTLDERWLKRMEYANTMRARLDEVSNSFHAEIKPLLSHEAVTTREEDDWFRVLAGKVQRAKGAYASQLRGLCSAHEKAGRPLGDDVASKMRGFDRTALRLQLRAHNVKRRAIEHRRHIYRNVAARIAAKSGLIALENVDLREIARTSNAQGAETDLVQAARNYRTWAAASELRLAIEQAGKREGREIVKAIAANTTRVCSSCGHHHDFPIEDLTFVCQGCGKVWDQDENAAHNIRKNSLRMG
jgi:hypothetical protein